jgi:hypothetical protein
MKLGTLMGPRRVIQMNKYKMPKFDRKVEPKERTVGNYELTTELQPTSPPALHYFHSGCVLK